MKNDFDSLIAGGTQVMRRGASYMLQNLGKAVALITALVTALVIFTEVSFSGFGARDLTSTLIAVLISSYVIYFSLADAGERAAKETAEYKSAYNAFCIRREKISGDMIGDLRRFCEEYSKEELMHRRLSYLISYGLDTQGYDEYLLGKIKNAAQRRVYRRAKRMRAVSLSPKLLLSFERVAGAELSNPEKTKTAGMLIKLLPTTVCTLLTVSMALHVRDGLTAEAIIEGIFHLSTLPVVALRGYLGGYGYVKGPLTLWQKTKADILDAFLSKG